MKIHEYQAKDLFREYGILVPAGSLAKTPSQAEAIAKELHFPLVLKAQVHSGGRGKVGGVRVVREMAEVAPTAQAILGLTIQGLPVNALLIMPAVDVLKELYLGILTDRSARKVVFMGCAEGGVEIERTARVAPEEILRQEAPVHELAHLSRERIHDFTAKLLPEPQTRQLTDLMTCMARLFVEKDCSLVEINPVVVDTEGDVLALDAKILLDDNALFRHAELLDLRDMSTEDADELLAKEHGLSFVRLDGDIGCMVNGAGLAMATMDAIKGSGAKPANFLDVGGSSQPQKVVTGFRLILKDPGVSVVLVNIFGGITRCDDIAKGLLDALSADEVQVPIVIRLIGTNETEGRRLLEGTDLIQVRTLEEGAAKAAEIAAER